MSLSHGFGFTLSLLSNRPPEQLAAIPEFQGLGPLFKSSDPVQLTEAETEYVVRCVKHTFAGHMVFQFDCTNTLNDQLLQKVPAERGRGFLFAHTGWILL